MENFESIKAAAVSALKAAVDEKVLRAKADLAEAIESRNSATKSSAGDKHETGRAMMQIETENCERQLAKALGQRAELAQIDFSGKGVTAERGSMVCTDRGLFLICTGAGKIEVDGKTCYAVSAAAPLGAALLGAKAGDKVDFRGQVHKVAAVV